MTEVIPEEVQPQISPDNQPDIQPRTANWLSRRAKIIGVAVLGVGGLMLANNAGIDLFEMEQQTELEQDVDVITIDPIDFGCFVRVEAEAELTGHQRNVLRTPFGSKTFSTDSTTIKVRGDSELCVDNTDTEIIKTEAGGLAVTIGELFSNRPRIDHDGEGAVESTPSVRTRIRNLGAPNNDDVVEGLQVVGQFMMGQAACVDEAVRVAKDQIQKHYDDLGQAFGYPDVDIIYEQTARSGAIPQGRANDFLEGVGFEIPQDFDIDIDAPRCNATMINGQPAISEQV